MKGVVGFNIEADYIVNADESNYSKQNIKHTKNIIFKTKSGIEILEYLYENNFNW